jgi:phosphate starvation-inducible PhoH-like protein
MPYSETKLKFRDNEEAVELLGSGDENLRYWESLFDVRFRVRGDELIISGERDDVHRVSTALRKALRHLPQVPPEDRRDLLVSALKPEPQAAAVVYSASGKAIVPFTPAQADYIRAMANNVITFSIGPAGTGKTFLAVAYGVRLLKEAAVDRIILTRPAVEAGESLGFLPGDILEKINPYLRPLYDALFEILGVERTRKLIDKAVVEVAPLAFMRGRTLQNAFIILDEAQNVKRVQMKMFLTRLGPHARAVITGDITQVDLAHTEESGLTQATGILQDIPGIGFVTLTHRDVIRHPIVSSIIRAYDESGRSRSPDKPD